MEFDGLFLANGPGDPDMCEDAVKIIQKQMSLSDKPICGICMGNQLLAKAAGAHIYKLKYGHRSHNQPVRMVGTEKCFVTSQNHGYAVDAKTLGKDWEELFVNMNDGSNEGIRHKTKPWFSSQFHPEACSGPVDTEFMFGQIRRSVEVKAPNQLKTLRINERRKYKESIVARFGCLEDWRSGRVRLFWLSGSEGFCVKRVCRLCLSILTSPPCRPQRVLPIRFISFPFSLTS